MNTIFVDVIVNISVSRLDRVFQYHVPDSYIEDIYIGCQVDVPFGKGGRTVRGFVTDISEAPSIEPERIKDILNIVHDAPAADEQLIRLASWMHVKTGATMSQSLQTVLPVKRAVREKKAISYELADREKAEELLQMACRNKREKARVRLLEALLREGTLPQAYVTGAMRISPGTLKAVMASGVMKTITDRIWRGNDNQMTRQWQKVALNEAQLAVCQAMTGSFYSCQKEWNEYDGVHLLYGITGSGKTEVYISLISQVLSEGRQVIVLIPEISLTLQTVSRFYEYFGSRIAVMHSRLSAGERYDQYMRARSGEADIMIGPRSALFTPFDRLGLIIIDEEHDGAYKSEKSPRYHARDAAIERARISGAMVVLGSATPSMTSLYHALNGRYQLHRLNYRAKAGSSLPEVQVIDLREELRLKNKGILSRALKDELTGCLQKGQQAMLFLNRRGFAGFVSCRSCGHVIKCSHCDVAMTAHKGGLLKCHYCGNEAPAPKLCPSCGSPYIAAFGIGTQKVQDLVQQEFPQARILRLDRDTTAGKNDMADILRHFAEGKADILIGTQMIVKGHDFDNVSLVGILAADLSMHSGDYLSSERTCQLLMQAAGRAGRSDRRGKVIIQTYQPDHYAITAAAAQDYDAFYEQEICFRRIMGYPPVSQLLQMLVESGSEKEAAAAAGRISEMVKNADFPDVVILGPVKAGISKGKDLYRFVMYAKHPDEEELIRLRTFIEGYLAYSDTCKNIMVGFDMNPMTLA